MSGVARPRRLRSSGAPQPDAPACGAPAEASPRQRRASAALPRVPSEQLIKTAHLVRSESSKHLLQHLSMIASGAWIPSQRAPRLVRLTPVARRRRAPAGHHLQPHGRHLQLAVPGAPARAIRARGCAQVAKAELAPREKRASSVAPRVSRPRWTRCPGYPRALTPRRQPWARAAAQIVSYTYWAYEWYRCAALFVMVTLCSLLADSVMPQSKFITSADRVFATAGTLVSPVSARAALR